MGWYEDWQRQNLAFTPRMDQGGGEYTGYIKDVYEGDDAQRAWMPEFFPAPDQTTRKMMGNVQSGQVGVGNYSQMKDPEEGWGALYNKLYGDKVYGGTGANALISANTSGVPDILRERAVAGEVAPGGPDIGAIVSGKASPNVTGTGAPWSGMADLAKKTGNLIPEAYLDAGFGMYDKIIADVKRDFDQGGGALDPTSHNNYVQQLIKAGANSETIARLMDRFLPMAESAAGVLEGLGQSTLIGDKVDTAAKYGKGLLGYGSKLADYLGEQGRFTKKFWGDTYDEQLGNVKDKYRSLFPAAEQTRDWSTLNSGPFNPQGGQFEDFTGEGSGAVANPLMGNSVITPQDQSWSGGFMDQPPGRGLDKAGLLEKSPLGQMFRDKSETSDIVNAYSQDNINPITRKPRQTAKEKLTSLGEGMHSVAGDAVDWTADHARGAGITAAGGAGLNWAYNRTDMGKLKTQLKNADTDFARKNIQARIDEKKAQRRAKFKKDHLPKGVRNFNTTKLLAVVGGLAFGLGMADFVLAAGGGDEDVATEWAMDFVDNNPGIMKGIEAGTQLMDPIGTALGGGEQLSNRMGPASENYWATPGFGSASGVLDPNWRN